jgi:hypothetical protein
MPFRASRRAAFSLGTFSWPGKRKYLALRGERKYPIDSCGFANWLQERIVSAIVIVSRLKSTPVCITGHLISGHRANDLYSLP